MSNVWFFTHAHNQAKLCSAQLLAGQKQQRFQLPTWFVSWPKTHEFDSQQRYQMQQPLSNLKVFNKGVKGEIFQCALPTLLSWLFFGAI